jgi:hypothetical protein
MELSEEEGMKSGDAREQSTIQNIRGLSGVTKFGSCLILNGNSLILS